MTTSHPQVSALSDPVSLARLQILLVPVQLPAAPLHAQVFEHWSTLFKSNTNLRGDEIRPTTSSTSSDGHGQANGHVTRPSTAGGTASAGSGTAGPSRNRSATRFIPDQATGSISRGSGGAFASGPGSGGHVHLSYPSHPPPRHLSNLSLLRISLFPLVVIGIAVHPGDDESSGLNGPDQVEGYKVEEGDGAATPKSAARNDPSNRNGTTSVGDGEQSISAAFDEAVASLFPPTSPYPLVKRLILVPPQTTRSAPASAGTSSNTTGPDETPRMRPAELNGSYDRKGKGVDRQVLEAPSAGAPGWVSTVLGEVVGDVLAELGDLATALETQQGLKTLSATLLPSLTSNDPNPTLDTLFPTTSTPSTIVEDLPPRPSTTTPVPISHSQTLNDLTSASRASTGISLKRALTPGGRPTSVAAPSLPPLQTNAITSSSSVSRDQTPTSSTSSSNPFRRSSALPAAFTRSSSAASIATTANSAPNHMSTSSKYTTASLSGLAGGRLLKLLGDMYLIAGMYGDAIKCFEDGAERCRAVGDVLWEALAREGRAVAGIGEAWEGRDGSDRTQPFPTSPIPVEILTHFLSSLACLSRAPLPYPSTILSPAPQAVSGTLSFAGPSSSNSAAVGTGEGLLAYLHTGLSLRIANFLLVIWASGGWGSTALSCLFSHSLPRSFPPLPSTVDTLDSHARRERRRQLAFLRQRSQLDRHQIYGHAEEALRPLHRALTKAEQVQLYTELTWLSRWLDLPRKEAFVTREMVKRIATLIVESREEARRKGAAGFRRTKSRPTSSSIAPGTANGQTSANHAVSSSQGMSVRRRESTEGNEGVMTLFERAMDIMGVQLLALSPGSKSPNVQYHDSDSEAKAPRYGWPELQVEMIKEGIAVAESLPDQMGVIRLCMTTLKELYSFLNPPSQVAVSKMLPQALNVVRRRGMQLGNLPWWIPGSVVLSMELASLPPNRLPLEHSRDEIKAEKGRDPFLYNPRLKAGEAGKTVLVAREQVEIYVTLKNPFAFDLEIKDLSLLTAGVDFSVNPVPLSLPPYSIQSIRITGMATSTGVLQVKGVRLRLPDGSACDMLLPLINDAEQKRQQKRKSRAVAEYTKVKERGTDARFQSINPESARDSVPVDSSVVERWLECKVVDEQPLIWIKRTSLTHGTIMLYDGETSTIRITLENSSSTPVDFIKLSFEDSLSRSAQALVSEGEISPQYAHQLEWETLNRPIFTWDEGAEVMIPPGGRTTIAVKCLGKVGCTDGTIRIDYGYVKREGNGSGHRAIPPSFQTRQISFPVMFTVYHMLEPHSLDIIRLDPSSALTEDDKVNDAEPIIGLFPTSNGHLSPMPSPVPPASPGTPRLREMEERSLKETMMSEMDGDHCLVGLCVSNVYGAPFEVSLSRKAIQGQDELVTTRLVPPGATERLVIPMARLSLPSSITSQPIPSLSNRQYVVEKGKRTPAQIQDERRLFWYREELLKTIFATWIEPGSKRSGIMSLRDQYVPPPLLEVLHLDDLEVEIIASPRQDGTVLSGDFADLTVKVVNRLERPFQPFIQLEPIPTASHEPSWARTTPQARRPPSTMGHNHGMKNVIFDGCTSQVLPLIPPGKGAEHRVSAIFLASGEYSFRAAVDEVLLRGQGGQPVPYSEVGAGAGAGTGAGAGSPKVRFSPLLTVRVGSGTGSQ